MSGSNRTTTESTQNQSSQTSPWAPQGAALSTGFDAATNLFNSGNGIYSGDRVASFNLDQLSTFQRMLGYSGKSAVPDAMGGAGGALLGNGLLGTAGALSGFSSFDPSAGNNPAALIDAANKYVSGQDIDAQVNNAMLNARQTARDVTLPGIGQNAALNGNTNSSRTGIAEGLVERGLAQQAADLGGSLRSKAFSDGLSLASSNANANNTARLAALSGMGSLGSSASSLGLGALSGSIDNMGKLFDIANAGGSGLQAANQAGLDNDIAKAGGSWDAMKNYMNLIGSQSYGSSTTGTSSGTSTQTSTPSAWQVIGGLMGGAGSLFGRNGFNLFSSPSPTWDTSPGNGAGGHPVATYR